MLSELKERTKTKSAVAVQYLKGEVNRGEVYPKDFTAKVFSILSLTTLWRMSGSHTDTDTDKVTYKIQLDIPKQYLKGVYKLEDHHDIKISYTTTNLHDPLDKYVREGLLDLTEVDAANGHVQGALAGGKTADDGDGKVFTVDFLFSFG